MSRPIVSTIMPAYNSGSFIAESVNKLLSFYDEYAIDGEIIVIDDGSIDNTFNLVPKKDNVQAIQFQQNQGKGSAVKAGMGIAQGRVCVFTDADLPYGIHPILMSLHYILEKGFHAVVGDRTLPGSTYTHYSFARKRISSIGSLIFRTLITGGIYDTQCGFKGFRSDVAKELFLLTRTNRFAVDVEIIYLLMKYHLDIKRIPVRLHAHKSSTINVVKDSVQVLMDIPKIQLNWRLGYYNSRELNYILKNELEKDATLVKDKSKIAQYQ